MKTTEQPPVTTQERIIMRALVDRKPTVPAARKAITIRLSDSDFRKERKRALVVIFFPFLVTTVSIPLCWNQGVGILDLILALSFYCISALGITVGFHRMLTHRSFEAVKPVRTMLAVAGTLALQGPVIKWVADHRRHHVYSDQDGDPHSPHLHDAPGIKGFLQGLWHAHLGWVFHLDRTNIEKFAPDLLADPAIKKVNDLFPLIALCSIFTPALLGLLITQSLYGALTAFIWAGIVRIFFLHHVTWGINSLCHLYGSRSFETKDQSTNNWAMALLSMGEGWHNNHHAFPTSYRHGLTFFQIDFSAWFIALMNKMGLVSNLKQPTEAQINQKQKPAGGNI